MYEKRCVIGLLMDHLLHHWTVQWSLSRMCHHQSLQECYTLAICRCEVLIVETLAQPLLQIKGLHEMKSEIEKLRGDAKQERLIISKE